MGAIGTRSSLRPLFRRRANEMQSSGETRRENAKLRHHSQPTMPKFRSVTAGSVTANSTCSDRSDRPGSTEPQSSSPGVAWRKRSAKLTPSDGKARRFSPNCLCRTTEPPRRKSNLTAPPATNHPDGQLSKTRQSATKKIFRLAFDPTQLFNVRVSPDTRGGSRSSRTRVEMRWTPNARLTSAREADGEVVWS